LRLMGQPIDQAALQSVLLTIEEVEHMSLSSAEPAASAGEGGAMITETTSSADVTASAVAS